MPKSVMIVEDNELNMKLFNDLLESRGYTVIQTRNGMEALDLARAHMPDLILMDIQLPEVSGLVVTKWLKDDEQLAHIPVVAVTAFVDPETGRLREVHTRDSKLRERYAQAAREQREEHARVIREAGADHMVLRTDSDWLFDLVRFVALRRKRMEATVIR